MTRALAVLAASGLDAALGEPPNALHPVAWMGSAIARGRTWALEGGAGTQLLRGAVVAIAVPAVSAEVAYGVAQVTDRAPLVSALEEERRP